MDNNVKLYLKLLRRDDIHDEYLSWHQNEEHIQYYSSSGRTFSKETLLAEMEDGIESKTLYIYGIYFKEGDKLIGNIKIGPISNKHKTSDLVAFIGDPDFLGKGLSKEAIKLGNEVAFKNHDIRKLFGGMFRSNIASVKGYLKADWIIEGVLKGQYIVEGNQEDRILVACFNPKYFDVDKIKSSCPTYEDIYDQ